MSCGCDDWCQRGKKGKKDGGDLIFSGGAARILVSGSCVTPIVFDERTEFV